MQIRQLRYFVAVAELESFTAASNRLNVVQSALSRQIANLEDELGVLLFHRNGRSIELAPAGERLQKAASKILLDLEDLKSVVRVSDDEIFGTVAIGAHYSDGDVLLPKILERVFREYPGIKLDPIQGLTADLQDMLLRGTLDLAIVTFPDPLPGLDLEPIAQEKLYLAGPTTHFPIQKLECTLAEALNVPQVVSHKPNRERNALEEQAKRHNVTLKISVEADGLSLMKLFSMQGRGALILPETALRMEMSNSNWKIIPIQDFTLTRWLSRRSSLVNNTAVTKVQSILLEEIDTLKKLGMMH